MVQSHYTAPVEWELGRRNPISRRIAGYSNSRQSHYYTEHVLRTRISRAHVHIVRIVI